MRFPAHLILMMLSGVSTAFAAEKPIACAEVGSPAYLAAKAAVDAGYLNLGFLSLDRVIRASATANDPTDFVAALGCLDQVQEKSGLVDLPNYDDGLRLALPRVKTADGQAVLAHFAFRSGLQRIASGASSSKALDGLRPSLKASPFFEASVNGLAAAARADYATARPALEKALALSVDVKPSVKPSFQADLRLALGRVRYASKDDAGAIAQYEVLYKIGAPMQDALIESAWAQLRSKNYMKALGLSFELSTGKLAQFFAPEALSIRSIGFLENCRYSESRNTIARFSAEYGPLADWLKKAKKSDHPLYEMAVARAEGAIGAEALPEKVWSMWSSSDLFIALQNGISGAFVEERGAVDWIAGQADAKVKATLQADLKKLPALRERAASRIESHFETINAGMASRIARESERMRFVRVEANQGAGRDLVYRNANPGLAEVEKKAAKDERKAKSYKGKLGWGKVEAEDPKAEMWIDEIGNYEAATLDRCKAKAEYKKLKETN